MTTSRWLKHSIFQVLLVIFPLAQLAQAQNLASQSAEYGQPAPPLPSDEVAMSADAALPSEPLPQTPTPAAPSDSQAPAQDGQPQANPAQTTPPQDQSQQQKANQQVHQEEHQRILGILPNFNTSYLNDAVPLSPKQKFSLAFHSAIDPATFVVAAIDAGYNQETKAFPGYGQGAQGFGKYMGASYTDSFDGTMLGNALFPVILKQDPRYFRRGTGSIKSRLLYSLKTTVWCKNDDGSWGPNYSNVVGNLAAGGISNLYYPPAQRGAALTFERGFTVTAEGSVGAVLDEFWPDIAHKLFGSHLSRLQPNLPPPAQGASPAPKE